MINLNKGKMEVVKYYNWNKDTTMPWRKEYKVRKHAVLAFYEYWEDQFGDVNVVIKKDVVELFLMKYSTIEEAADELNEFCKRYDEPENEVRGGLSRTQDIEGDLWIKW